MKLDRADTAVASVLCLLAVGCVSTARYDAAVRDGDQAKQAAAQAGERVRADAAEITRLSNAFTEAENALQQRDEQLSDANVSAHNLQAKLDETVAIDQQLRSELTRLGKDVDQLLRDKGTLTRSLDDIKARLEALRRAEQAAEARRATLQRLTLQLKPLADAGFLSVGMREWLVVITVPSDKLFEGAKAEIRGTGEPLLKQIAIVLKTYPDRRFQIRAHIDRRAKAPPGWEPASARAIEVVRRLVALGVRPEALSAATYAEYDPISAGETVEARTKNRRVEIAFVPRSDELVAQPSP